MLYDNALLALAYLEAYQATGRDDFAAVARDILRDADRDMSLADGGFASATDADSAGPDGRRREGWFFTWTPDEVTAALAPEAARRVIAAYGVTAAGNFEGRNILHQARATDAVAQELGITPAALRESLAAARETLYAARARRPPPLRDDKVLAAWNGLMIAALARAALVLDDAAYAQRAARAAEFVLGRMRVDGRLRRSFAGGAAHHDAYLADYAFMIAGLLDLYEATGERRWLDQSIELDRVLADHYEDAAGGFFATSDDHETLLAREKPADDGAEPSGNSVQASTCCACTGSPPTTATASAPSAPCASAPLAAVRRRWRMLRSPSASPPARQEIVIVVPPAAAGAVHLAELRRRISLIACWWSRSGQDLAHQAERVPLLAGKTARRQGDGLRLQAAGLRSADVGSGGVRQAAPGRRRIPVEQPAALEGAAPSAPVESGSNRPCNGRRRSGALQFGRKRPPPTIPAQQLGRGAQGAGRNGAPGGRDATSSTRGIAARILVISIRSECARRVCWAILGNNR